MVRAFLSSSSIIHPSSFLAWQVLVKRDGSAITSATTTTTTIRTTTTTFRDRGVLRETFLFPSHFDTFLHFSFCFCFCVFNTWIFRVLRTHNKIGSWMWFPFKRRYIVSNGVLILFSFILTPFFLGWGLLNGVGEYLYGHACTGNRWMGGWGSRRLLGGLACVDVGKYSRDSICSVVNSSVWSGLAKSRVLCYDVAWIWAHGWRVFFVFFCSVLIWFQCCACLSVAFSFECFVSLFFYRCSPLLIELYSYPFSSPCARLLSPPPPPPPFTLKTCVYVLVVVFSRFPECFLPFFSMCTKSIA